MSKNPEGRHSVRRTGKPNPVDVHVGSRVRLRRTLLGLSQEKLGEAIGLTFQQVQKYERGANRIGASRLHELSRVLDVPISFFFDDTDPVRAPAIPGGFAEPPAEAFESDPLRKRETVELVEAYFAVEDAAVRRRLLDLAKVLAAENDPNAERRPARETRRGRRPPRTPRASASVRRRTSARRNLTASFSASPPYSRRRRGRDRRASRCPRRTGGRCSPSRQSH